MTMEHMGMPPHGHVLLALWGLWGLWPCLTDQRTLRPCAILIAALALGPNLFAGSDGCGSFGFPWVFSIFQNWCTDVEKWLAQLIFSNFDSHCIVHAVKLGATHIERRHWQSGILGVQCPVVREVCVPIQGEKT